MFNSYLNSRSFQHNIVKPGPHAARYLGAVFIATMMVLLALVSPKTAHAGLFDDDEARKAILDLRSKVETQNRDLVQKNQELAARTEQLEQASKGMLQLSNQIEQLRADLARLRGQIELQNNDLAALQKGQRDMQGAIESRIKPLEPITVQIDGKATQVQASEKRRFDAAMTLIRAGDFRGSLQALTQFQFAYPDSPYLPSVNYWIGASQYGLKDYKASITTMQSIVSAQTDTPRIPDAIFTLGMAQVESGDRRTGRRTLETLVERFPESPLAATAKERIATIRP